MEEEEYHKIVWNIIDKYFKSNNNIFVRHHLDSFNDFFNNKIFNIFRDKNPIKILKNENDDTKDFDYKAYLYIGGKDGNKIYYGKPIIYDDSRSHFMFPNEARLRNMTYGITIHFDLEIEYSIYNNEKNIFEETTQIYEKIYLGKFPIMLNSDLCILNTLDNKIKFNMGECKNDNGGYFIIDGKEKVIISQEKFADNMIYVRDNYNELYSHGVDIKSVSEDSSKPIRTLSIRILRPDSKYKNNNIVVNIPNVRKPIPLFILMRALGIISDKSIIKYCLLDLEKYKNYMNIFIPSIHDAGNIFNQVTAIKYIATFTKGKTVAHVMEILMDYLLPHIGESNFNDKALFIGYMVLKMLKVFNKQENPTDRDNFNFKRVELSGSLLYDLFKEYYNLQQKHIYQKIDKEYYYKQGLYQNNDFILLIENNYLEFFKERILENGFSKAFKGSWGSEEHTRRPEVIQDLNRLSFNSYLSHLRKLNLPLDSNAKVVGPRLLHSSQWGFIDPFDTPDGGNVGLHKHLSLGTQISTGYSSKNIIKFLRNVLLLEYLSETTLDNISKSVKVFVNGNWVGIINNPTDFKEVFLKYRRIGLIPIHTSINWSIKENIIYICCDAGRLTRPIFFIQDETLNITKIKSKLLSNDFEFNNLLIGYNKINKISIDNLIRSNAVINDPKEIYSSDNIDTLYNNSGNIDYIDSSETENILITNDLKKINKNTTHFEIHESLIMGIMGNQIVFPENNQLPRNLFSCGQSKQAVSLYNSNYYNRIDKMGVVLNNGQVPLVKSRYLKYINNEEHPYGVNVIVAIGSYGGYNVEDSILFNEGSIKRGMFNTTYFNMYESREESSKVAGSNIDSQFANIEKENVIGKKPGYDYSHLNNEGLIKENTYLNDKIVVIGKMKNNLNNPDNFIDDSTTPKKGQLGFVDKSFITEEESGFRLAKVRIREERIPAMGDKFCSRCGQKGTVGLIIPENNMPFTDNGIRPDLIINPHALPSRMTIGQLIETLMGKACSIYGGFGDCTAFINKGPKHEIFGKMLQNIGYHSSGNEILYNGESGEQLSMELFIGPCYYMRLKHMVKDKINYRGQGPRTILTRQTVQGRANDGGLRIGEMERDTIISHGATYFLQESMLKRGDDYYVAVCNKTGCIAIYNESKNMFISPFADGPLKFNENIDNNLNIELISKYGRSFSIIRIPYCFKLLLQELQVFNIQMRIITDKNIDHLTSMNYSNTCNLIEKNRIISEEKIKSIEEESIKLEKTLLKDKLKEVSKKEIEEQDSDDDNSGLSQVTIESVKRAEEEYRRSQSLDDDDDDEEEYKKPPITVGEKIDEPLDSVVEILQDDVINEANPNDTTPVKKLLDTDSKIDNKSIVEKKSEISNEKDDSKLKGGNTSKIKILDPTALNLNSNSNSGETSILEISKDLNDNDNDNDNDNNNFDKDIKDNISSNKKQIEFNL